MSKFHSSVSRREFVKGLGLAGAGLGATSILAPGFHDLDEVMSSENASQKRPWYVKERDEGNPTIEIDWALMKRFDGRDGTQGAHTRAYFYGKDRVLAAAAVAAKKLADFTAANASGYTYRSRALTNAFTRTPLTSSWTDVAGSSASLAGQTVNGYVTQAKTPEQRGEPKWTGTPEEAALMLRAAMRSYGAALVGYSTLTQQERDKLLFTYEKGNSTGNEYIDVWPPPNTIARPIVYENVDKAYDGGSKLVIPTKQLWHVSMSTLGANDQWRRSPSPFGGMANNNTFYNTANLHASTWNFIRYLGYQMIGTIGNDSRYSGAEQPGAVFSGVCETSRQRLYGITPEHGAPGRLYSWLTDLPLAPTNPIDAGIWRFCHSCHKCADTCPSGSISQDKEPSWDVPQVEGKPDISCAIGTKNFHINMPSCNMYRQESDSGCRICWGECTFTVNRGSMVHQVVKGTVANTNIFNSFFYKMGKQFGYGSKDPESWWDENLPVLGQDSVICATDGGYKK